MRFQRHLQKELRMEGASRTEAKELAALAQNLSTLNQEPETIRNHSVPLGRWLIPTVTALGGIFIGIFLVSLSQAAPPDSMLYPVQKATDNAAIFVNPSYRASVMMKRAAQVHELVLTHAQQSQIMAVLDDYANVAHSYMVTTNTNYAAFEYCETNLKSAAIQSTPPVREAIMKSLQSIST